jgi:hypothetical protein
MFVLDRPVELEKGVLYHLVFSNPAPDPVGNWTSIDCLHVRRNAPGVQPGISDTDLAVVFKPDARHSWANSHRATPIFCLFYNDGQRQGQGYVDSDSGTGGKPIAGPSRVRERFTVRGETVRVRSVSVRLRRQGNPGDLLVRLEQGDGRVVEEVAVPSRAIGVGDTWIESTFPRPRELLHGATYQLVLSAPAGDPYRAVSLVEGTTHGFDCPNLYRDGRFESSDGGPWTGDANRDLPFFFQVAEPPAQSFGTRTRRP